MHALLQEIAPGSTLLAIGSLPSSYSNFTHLIEARSADGSDFRLVVRRYKVFGNYDRAEKARREFKTFELLQRNGIPSPRPLYLDEPGAVLGTPGIVTSFVPGAQVESPSDPVSWARACGDVSQNPCHSLRHRSQAFLAGCRFRGYVVFAFWGRAGLHASSS